MSVKVRPYLGRSNQWEVDIRFKWPDGTECRKRLRAPGTSKTGARKWAEARERD